MRVQKLCEFKISAAYFRENSVGRSLQQISAHLLLTVKEQFHYHFDKLTKSFQLSIFHQNVAPPLNIETYVACIGACPLLAQIALQHGTTNSTENTYSYSRTALRLLFPDDLARRSDIRRQNPSVTLDQLEIQLTPQE